MIKLISYTEKEGEKGKKHESAKQDWTRGNSLVSNGLLGIPLWPVFCCKKEKKRNSLLLSM